LSRRAKRPFEAGEAWECDGWIVLTVRPSEYFAAPSGWVCLILAGSEGDVGTLDDFSVHAENGFKRLLRAPLKDPADPHTSRV
jgi:hypothetical protein